MSAAIRRTYVLNCSITPFAPLLRADQEVDFLPIKVVVEGKEDIAIWISDEGGAIPRSAIPLIWTYMYTTMESKTIDKDLQTNDFKTPMAEFGYRLLSRLVSILPFMYCLSVF